MLKERLEKRNLSIYQCSQMSGISYSTLRELICGKTKIENCAAGTLYRLSKVLETSMEELLIESSEYRCDFETFKGNVCHKVKEEGDLDFIIETVQTNVIRKYWEKQWYPEAFYLLAMVDYLSIINEIPLCSDYADIRSCKLKEIVYPRDIQLTARMSHELDVKEKSYQESIPEFQRFNIVESEVRNVC